jgi:hypothetical protein
MPHPRDPNPSSTKARLWVFWALFLGSPLIAGVVVDATGVDGRVGSLLFVTGWGIMFYLSSKWQGEAHARELLERTECRKQQSETEQASTRLPD